MWVFFVHFVIYILQVVFAAVTLSVYIIICLFLGHFTAHTHTLKVVLLSNVSHDVCLYRNYNVCLGLIISGQAGIRVAKSVGS